MTSLYEALQRLQQLDDDDDLDLLASLEAIEATKDKVDSYKTVIDQLSLQAEFFREKAREATIQARRAENVVERVKERMIFCLKTFDTTELVGHEHRVKLSYLDKVEILREPKAEDLFTHDNLLRHKFEWDKKKIAEAIAEGTNADDFAKIVSSPSIRWSYASTQRTSKSSRKSTFKIQENH